MSPQVPNNLPDEPQVQDIEVEWAGQSQRLWNGMQVLNYGAEEEPFLHAMHIATLVSVDPGDPSGVACFPYERRYPITLHTITPELLARGVIRGWSFDLVCETPLHGTMRVYDPNPWKVRGYLELHAGASTHGRTFVPAEVGWLKAGKGMAHVRTRMPHEQRHAKDALAYAATAVALNIPVREWQAEHLGADNR